jgi:hypothetical protein
MPPLLPVLVPGFFPIVMVFPLRNYRKHPEFTNPVSETVADFV